MNVPTESLKLIPLSDLQPHPLNANLMSEELRAKVATNIQRSGRYPPLIVRPLPNGRSEILDGEQRFHVLRALSQAHAWCYEWPCSDDEALILLATLNRLEGQDIPGKRAALIAELQAHESLAELARLLPEDEAGLEQTLALLDFDVDGLIARLTAEAERSAATHPVLFSFAVEPGDAELVESAITAASQAATGKNHRGQALVELARTYTEGR